MEDDTGLNTSDVEVKHKQNNKINNKYNILNTSNVKVKLK